MAPCGMIGDHCSGPVAQQRRRGSGASLFILVQVQAGPPPAFAAPQLRLGKRFAAKAAAPWLERAKAGSIRLAFPQKLPVDGPAKTLSRLRKLV